MGGAVLLARLCGGRCSLAQALARAGDTRAEAERFHLIHRRAEVGVEAVRSEELRNAHNAEELELGRAQVRKVDADATLLVRAHELVQDLQSTGVDLLDLERLAVERY